MIGGEGYVLENDYRPDTHEPVDRWFQARNASNVRTTLKFIAQFATSGYDFVVDPFAGGGSTACAARILERPFYGIEIHPILACVTIAKTAGTVRQAELPPDLDFDALDLEARPILDLAGLTNPGDRLYPSTLQVLAALRACGDRPISAGEILTDLTLSVSPTPGRIVCGDAGAEEVWEALHLPAGPAVVYCSPPFGSSSPVIEVPLGLRSTAYSVPNHARLIVGGPEPRQDRETYAHLTESLIEWLVERVDRATVILEHETDGDGDDTTPALMEPLAGIPRVRTRPQVHRYGTFSPRGVLSLVVLEIG